MNLLMISGDRALAAGKHGAFWATLDELRRHWERIDVVCPRVAAPQPSPFPNVFLHPSPWGLHRQPKWIAETGADLVRTHRHAVATVHDYPPFYNSIGAKRLSRATGLPYVIEIHHVVGWPEAADMKELAGKALSRLGLQWVTRGAAAVRCVNRTQADLLRRWGVRVPVDVIPSMYLDHAQLQPGASISKTVDVMACGRLVPNKGFDRLIAALALLPSATLRIVGDGPDRARLERLAEHLAVRDRVAFSGWLPHNGLYATLQEGRVFAMVSLSEGGPRVALEAMALGLPVVATRVGLMPDVIRDGENGLLTDGAPDAIAAAIQRLLDDEHLRTLIGDAARGVLARFERSSAIAMYADYLKTIASSAHR